MVRELDLGEEAPSLRVRGRSRCVLLRSMKSRRSRSRTAEVGPLRHAVFAVQTLPTDKIEHFLKLFAVVTQAVLLSVQGQRHQVRSGAHPAHAEGHFERSLSLPESEGVRGVTTGRCIRLRWN